MAKHRAEERTEEWAVGGYEVPGRISDRIRAQAPDLREERAGGERDSSNNDRIANP